MSSAIIYFARFRHSSFALSLFRAINLFTNIMLLTQTWIAWKITGLFTTFRQHFALCTWFCHVKLKRRSFWPPHSFILPNVLECRTRSPATGSFSFLAVSCVTKLWLPPSITAHIDHGRASEPAQAGNSRHKNWLFPLAFLGVGCSSIIHFFSMWSKR